MQSQRFVTEIWAENGPELQIVSSSWKSMFVQERLDASYAAFVGELHRRITGAATRVIWEQGVGPLKYWPGLVIFLAAALAMAALSVRALQAQAYAAAGLAFSWRRFFGKAAISFPQSTRALSAAGAAGRGDAEGLGR